MSGLGFSSPALESPLAMAEWIEIPVACVLPVDISSPLAMAEWIEIHMWRRHSGQPASPLAMAEWIEMTSRTALRLASGVSASDGGVD